MKALREEQEAESTSRAAGRREIEVKELRMKPRGEVEEEELRLGLKVDSIEPKGREEKLQKELRFAEEAAAGGVGRIGTQQSQVAPTAGGTR